MNWSQVRKTEQRTAIWAALDFFPYILLCLPIGWLPPFLLFGALDRLLGTRIALSPWPWLVEPISMLLGVYLFLQYLRWATRTDIRTALVQLEGDRLGRGKPTLRPTHSGETYALDGVFDGIPQVASRLYLALGAIYWAVSGWLVIFHGYQSFELVSWWVFGFSILALIGGICLVVLFYRRFRATVHTFALQLGMYRVLESAGDDAATHPFDWVPLRPR